MIGMSVFTEVKGQLCGAQQNEIPSASKKPTNRQRSFSHELILLTACHFSFW